MLNLWGKGGANVPTDVMVVRNLLNKFIEADISIGPLTPLPVCKTIHILKTLDDEEYRLRMGRELNKGEASHDLSRFLCFGKEGVLRGREFGDQLHTFSCLSVLHNAVVAWNTLEIGPSSINCAPRAKRLMRRY